MNLKEAFRFQNKLQSMMDEGSAILSQEQNITQVKTTYLRKKVMAGAEDETVIEHPTTPYSDQITEIAVFLMKLLREREKLSAAICRAKTSLELPAGFDGEVGLNGMRQDLAGLFRRMTNLRASETLIANGGSGYRFNNEGNQVSYRCDIKRVITINFDRNKLRRLCSDLSRQADETSRALDVALITAQVDYEPPFDVNDTFADAFEQFLASQPAS